MLGGNDILALDEAAGILPRPDVPEDDVALYGTKERNTGTDQDRNASDNEALNEPGLKKPLNRDPTIDVNVPNASGGKLRHDFDRGSRHALHHGSGRDLAKRASADVSKAKTVSKVLRPMTNASTVAMNSS